MKQRDRGHRHRKYQEQHHTGKRPQYTGEEQQPAEKTQADGKRPRIAFTDRETMVNPGEAQKQDTETEATKHL